MKLGELFFQVFRVLTTNIHFVKNNSEENNTDQTYLSIRAAALPPLEDLAGPIQGVRIDETDHGGIRAPKKEC